MENIKIDKERAWIFAVSTEYLLKDEIENNIDIPAVIINLHISNSL